MASPKERALELADIEESRPVYAPEDDSALSDLTARRPRTVSDHIRGCTPRTIRNGLIVFVLCAVLFCLFVATIMPRSSSGPGGQGGGTHHPELPSADNVKFFLVVSLRFRLHKLLLNIAYSQGFRHGNRNPNQFLKNDSSHEQWAWEGPAQLTNVSCGVIAPCVQCYRVSDLGKAASIYKRLPSRSLKLFCLADWKTASSLTRRLPSPTV